MEKLREADLNLAKEPLSSSQIDQRLHQSFLLGLPVPSRIASMVFKAITELGEENGSSEESISDYIKANYDDLPWAHKSIPSHHLNRLCDEGFIVLLASNQYSIPGFTLKPVLKDSEAPKLITYGKLRHGQKRRLFFQENREIDGLEDEHVKNGCENLVVVGDKEKRQEAEESENRLITELSIPEIAKNRARKIERKCDQLLIEGTEEESSEDDSDDDDHCYHPFETLVKKPKKEDAYSDGDARLVVYALAARLPNQSEPKRRRRVTRPFNESKEEPKMRLQKHDNQPEASIPSSQETESNWPSWIQSLLQTDFYGQCKFHGNVEKSICNLYCTDCKNGALCTSCVTSHEDEGHHVIAMNQTDCEVAVDVLVIGKYIDISEIQTLKVSATNTTIVLKRTIPSWFSKPTNNVCLFCKRRAPYPFKFCALSCKFQHEHKVG